MSVSDNTTIAVGLTAFFNNLGRRGLNESKQMPKKLKKLWKSFGLCCKRW